MSDNTNQTENTTKNEKNLFDSYSTSVQAVRNIVDAANIDRRERIGYSGVRVGGKVVAVVISASYFLPATITDRLINEVKDALTESGKYICADLGEDMLSVTKKV